MDLSEPLLEDTLKCRQSSFRSNASPQSLATGSTADPGDVLEAAALLQDLVPKGAGTLVQSIDNHLEAQKAPMPCAATGPMGSTRGQTGTGSDDPELMTGWEATFTVLNFTMNVGLLTLPLLYARHGWSTGLIMALVGGSCAYTALAMQESLVTLVRRGIPLPDFPDLAREAVGPTFAILAHAVALLEILGYMACNLIALAFGVSALVPDLGELQAMALTTVICAAMAGLPDRYLAYGALMSSASMAAIFACVLAWGMELTAWAQPTTLVQNVWDMPASFAVVIFTSGAHPLVPCVMHSTRSRHEFRSAIRWTWVIFSVFAITTGGVAFQMYGHALRPLITDNIGLDLNLRKVPGGGALRWTGSLWVVVKLFGSVIPSSRPVVRSFGHQLGVELPPGNGSVKAVLLTAPLLVVVAIISQLLKAYLATFESVIGCVVTSFNALFFPSLTYLAICQPKGLLRRGCAFFFVTLGGCLPLATIIPQVLQGLT